jgi:hypothetical protein
MPESSLQVLEGCEPLNDSSDLPLHAQNHPIDALQELEDPAQPQFGGFPRWLRVTDLRGVSRTVSVCRQ